MARKMRWAGWLAVIMLVAGMLLGAGPALAQDGEPTPPPDQGVTDDDVNAIAEQLYCPVCENVPLDVCGTKACADWRDEIRAMLEEGRNEAEIKAYFVERYGRQVLATPEARGFDLLLWVLPLAGVVGGAVVLVITLRRMAPGALAAQAAPRQAALQYDDLDPEYVARLERDLQEFAG